MLHTRPDVNAGPIERSLSPAKVGADIGSDGFRGSSFRGSSFGLGAGSCALLSWGLFAPSCSERSVCLVNADNGAGIDAAIKLATTRIKVILTAVLLRRMFVVRPSGGSSYW